MSVKPLLALPLALSLGACAVVGPNFQRPPVPGANQYAMAGDAAPSAARMAPEARSAGAWWQALGSAELDRTIRQALASSPSIAEADATLQRAREQAGAAQGALGPEANATAGAMRERINTASFGFAGFPSPTINLYSVGAGVAYDLDLFGGGKRRLEAARARVQAETARADAAYLSLSGNIALQALRIAALRAQLDALDAVIADDQRTLAMVDRAQELGGAAPSDLSVGRADLARDEAQRPAIARDLAAARHQLALLVGKAPADWTAPDFALSDFTRPADLPLSLPSTLVRQRPDIQAAEAELHAATAEVGVAAAALYPDIRLSANLTQGTIHPEDILRYDSTGWSLAGNLAAPLFNGGRLKANKRAAEASARAALARYNGVVLRAFVEVADALSALAEDDKAIAALTRVQQSQENRLKDARAAYELGGGTLLSVVQAQRDLAKSRRDVVQALGRKDADLVMLLTATATGWKPAAS